MPTLSYPYRSGHGQHPAPVLDVVVSWRRQRRVVAALIDSGAGRTAIPGALVNDLNLRQISEASVSGLNPGQTEKYGIYLIDIECSGDSIDSLPVIAVPGKPYVLVGRDILNRRVTVLDGPRLEFSLT